MGYGRQPIIMSTCQKDHVPHNTTPLKIYLKGEKEGYATIPKKYERKFLMDVFDWRDYEKYKGNCIGKDKTSKALQMEGIYEFYNTVVVLDILGRGNKRNLVIDYGAHIGWYTLLAILYGYDTAAVEADLETLRLLVRNVTYNNGQKKLIPSHAYIDENSPQLEVPANKQVQLLKIDIGHSDYDAVSMCESALRGKKINHLMIKISQPPDLANGLVHSIINHGYKVYLLPFKSFKYNEDFIESPLRTIRKRCQLDGSDAIEKATRTLYQTYLFIKDATK